MNFKKNFSFSVFRIGHMLDAEGDDVLLQAYYGAGLNY